MLNLNIGVKNQFPGRTPRFNRAHPLYCASMKCCAYAVRGGMTDFITGATVTNTTTLSGNDDNGPYIFSNDAAGTATIKFVTGDVTTYNFQTWGGIFRYIPVGSGRILSFGFGNTGLFITAPTGNFNLNGGTVQAFTMTPGHTYFLFMTNAVGTAAASRFCALVDLDTGISQIFRSAALDNLQITPCFALQPVSTFTQDSRVYAMFVAAAVLVPPAVQPAVDCFYSTDQVMAGLADPWGLWYA